MRIFTTELHLTQNTLPLLRKEIRRCLRYTRNHKFVEFNETYIEDIINPLDYTDPDKKEICKGVNNDCLYMLAEAICFTKLIRSGDEHLLTYHSKSLYKMWLSWLILNKPEEVLNKKLRFLYKTSEYPGGGWFTVSSCKIKLI